MKNKKQNKTKKEKKRVFGRYQDTYPAKSTSAKSS